MKISILSFDESAKEQILDLYGKTVDEDGFIVEKDSPKQRVLTPKGEEILFEEWAGVHKGSEAFIKSDTFLPHHHKLKLFHQFIFSREAVTALPSLIM